jgi:tRNA A-37 threonylcarbamoyl transferase component Bud32/membrane-associated phospholipid phosphatase
MALVAFLFISTAIVFRSDALLGLSDRLDTMVLRAMAILRVGWLNRPMRVISVAGSSWGLTVLGLGIVVALMVFRRWRHLLVFLISLGVMETVVQILYEAVGRPRPYGVTIIGAWAGYSMPSPPMAVLAATLVGLAYTLIVPGRPRWVAKLALLGVLFVFGTARTYLAVDHPSDLAYGVILGIAIPLVAFRAFTPNEVFPVAYRRGNKAHLDVSGRRGEAIRLAAQEQLGLTVRNIKPVGLEGSGGSTPLRLTVGEPGEPDVHLFAKLYAKSHVRADRWYKIGRTILYGALEDEASFQSVRRFVEYEDYTFRLMTDLGIPTAGAVGIVEITPEREYLLVTEFLDGAVEISESDVDDALIDQGLGLVRKLWDSGLAHRDIKPANLMVRDGKVFLIDAFFVQVRPSPWRQAVDLANMMLVLAVGSDAPRVYERALAFFTPGEIAEAFAATRGVASPTQLRTVMKRDGRDLLAEFRKLAPPRRPIAIQRWSVRRVALALGLALAILVASIQGVHLFLPTTDIGVGGSPDCRPNRLLVLMAQSVPSATRIPCLDALPSGWGISGVDVRSERATFWLGIDNAGFRAVRVDLLPLTGCNLAGAREVPSDEAGVRRFEHLISLEPQLRDDRFYMFPGGCVRYRFVLAAGAPSSMTIHADGAISFLSRDVLARYVEEVADLGLCGAGVACPS